MPGGRDTLGFALVLLTRHRSRGANQARAGSRIGKGMASSDATLVQRLRGDRSGDELRELYRRYAPELFGFATSALGDRELAEEVVQDVFAQLWRHANDYDKRRASVRTWLYAIARNRIIDAHRRAAVRPKRSR